MSGNTTTPVAMSGYITPAYTFTPGPSGVGTINLSGISSFNIKRLVAIINQTAGEIIYSSANSSYNYTNVVGTTITLKADTTGQNSTDILQVVYDTGYVVLDPTFPINIDSVYVSNEVEVKNDVGSPIPVSGPLTDAQLRATPVPVSISSSIELEVKNDAGNPLPISGTVSANQAGTWNINDVSGTISLPTGAATAAKQDTQSTQLTQIESAIDALSLNVVSPQDILGVGISGARYNQVEINFEVAPGAGLITETFTGGGFVTITSGHSIYATGAAATASTKVVTTQKVIYRPAHEIYSYFTAAFTTGVANTFQRIGIFDDNNGFYIGYENNLFGITKRTSGVNTFVARSLWNGDALNGGSTSNFTRNGIPEAINLNYSNLFRIRFAWLGSASVIFEVFSPDGLWVPFHTLKVPNSQYDPSIANPDLPLSLHVSKNAANGTNITIATACWAGGTTSDYVKISDTLTTNTLASLTRSVITGQTTAGGGGFVNVKVNPSGALNVAATQDGTWNINNITGTISLPTNAATLTAQNTGNASLSSIDTKTPPLGQAAMAASVPVVLASNQSNVPVAVQDTWKSTYTAGATNYVPYTNATDILTISGSATKTIRIYKIHISAIATSNINIHYDLFLIKRSTANTGGTPTLVTPVAHDSLNPAPTATVTSYASLPTLGTTVGTINQNDLFASTNVKGGDTPVQPNNVLQINFGTHPNLQPLTLRGANEVLAINLNGITVAANLEIDIEWTEE